MGTGQSLLMPMGGTQVSPGRCREDTGRLISQAQGHLGLTGPCRGCLSPGVTVFQDTSWEETGTGHCHPLGWPWPSPCAPFHVYAGLPPEGPHWGQRLPGWTDRWMGLHRAQPEG